MPSGHTHMATINQRRSLTDNMRTMLQAIRRGEKRRDFVSHPAGLLFWGELTTGEKNAVRALRDRGYVRHTDTLGLELTDAGRALVDAAPAKRSA